MPGRSCLPAGHTCCRCPDQAGQGGCKSAHGPRCCCNRHPECHSFRRAESHTHGGSGCKKENQLQSLWKKRQSIVRLPHALVLELALVHSSWKTLAVASCCIWTSQLTRTDATKGIRSSDSLPTIQDAPTVIGHRRKIAVCRKG